MLVGSGFLRPQTVIGSGLAAELGMSWSIVKMSIMFAI
jgi:hypothetical protein